LQPGRPLIGGGPFTLAVAFGLQADQRLTPGAASEADTPTEAATLLAPSGPPGQGSGPNELTEEEQKLVRELQARDREVRAHEAAHAAAGGQYAGAPQYTYQRGPDGRQYAIGGSVSIDTSPVQGDPEATLQKAQQIRRAAFAPAEPSAQDRAVAASAAALERQARAEIAAERQAELTEQLEGGRGESQGPAEGSAPTSPPSGLEGAGPVPGPGEDPRGSAAGGAFGASDDQAGFGRRRDDDPFSIAGPRAPSGFDGQPVAPQIISITD
jgi:hypothetical protein